MHSKLQAKLVGLKYEISRAPFNLTIAERRKIVTLLSKLAVPDGYSSNITRCAYVQDGKIVGMKSHDCHVLMQDLLVPIFRGVLDEKVLKPFSELSAFFKYLCSKTLKIDVLEQMEKNIAVTLCKLERIFVPAFFDVMVHLCVHLATEAKLGGPVHYRWMYAFERLMRIFKAYVRNKSRPEGSIANSVIARDCLTFCSRYMNMVETEFNRTSRNDGESESLNQSHCLSVFNNKGKPLGKLNVDDLSFDDWKLAHLYILRNCDEAKSFIDEYENENGDSSIDLCDWFKNRITKLWNEGDKRVNEELLCLARGSMKCMMTYEGYVANGFRFHTRKRQRKRRTQNSGVMVKGDSESGQRDFYGLLEKVIVLEYDSLKDRTNPRVVLCRCKWFDVFDDRRGIHKDKFGATLVNISRKLRTNEPFVLVSQIEQVFYVPTHNEAQWRIVIKTKPRNYFDFPNDENDNDDESLWEQVEVENVNAVNEDAQIDDDNYPIRNDVVPNLVDIGTLDLNAVDYDFDVDVDVDEETDDESNGNDEEEFSDRESSICSLDRDLENIGLDSDSDSDSSVVQESQVSSTQFDTSATNTECTQLSYRQQRRWQQAKRAEATTSETAFYPH
ncbi:unnamed protein product [Amaranthus hypochondriacus]